MFKGSLDRVIKMEKVQIRTSNIKQMAINTNGQRSSSEKRKIKHVKYKNKFEYEKEDMGLCSYFDQNNNS